MTIFDIDEPILFDPLTPSEAEAVLDELGDDFFLTRFPLELQAALQGGMSPADLGAWIGLQVSRAHQRLIEKPPLPLRQGATFDEIDGKLKDWS